MFGVLTLSTSIIIRTIRVLLLVINILLLLLVIIILLLPPPILYRIIIIITVILIIIITITIRVYFVLLLHLVITILLPPVILYYSYDSSFLHYICLAILHHSSNHSGRGVGRMDRPGPKGFCAVRRSLQSLRLPEGWVMRRGRI